MTIQYPTTTFPAVSTIRTFDPDIKTITIAQFSYDVWAEAGRYYIKALHTGAIKRFNSREAINDFVESLRWHIAHKYTQQVPTPAQKAVSDLGAAFDRYFAAFKETQTRKPNRTGYQWNKAVSNLKAAEQAVGNAAQRYYSVMAYEDAA